jgi:cob(I)alamin adenosyltransferase
MKIYTRTGDRGETGLLGGARVDKNVLRVETYGEMDELNAALGVARAQVSDSEIAAILEALQRDLFSVGALLADPEGKFQSNKVEIAPADVERLERHIDRFESRLPPLTRFLLPGGSAAAAALHLARAVARRAERRLVALSRAEPVPPALLAFLNRLSDLLFVLARWENHQQGSEESSW